MLLCFLELLTSVSSLGSPVAMKLPAFAVFWIAHLKIKLVFHKNILSVVRAILVVMLF